MPNPPQISPEVEAELMALLSQRSNQQQPTSDPLMALRGASSIGPVSPDRTKDLPEYSENQQPDMIAKMLELSGMDRPLEQMGGPSQAILPLGSAVRNPVLRGRMVTFLQDRAAGISKPVGDAFKQFSTRYPRLAATLDEVQVSPVPPARRRSAGRLVVWERGGEMPKSSLQLSPKLIDKESAASVLAHEGTHQAQALRASDRIRSEEKRLRGLVEDETLWRTQGVGTSIKADGPRNIDLKAFLNSQEYHAPYGAAAEKSAAQHDYFTDPLEVAARVTQELRTLPKSLPNRRALATRLAMDADRYDASIVKSLGAEKISDRATMDKLVKRGKKSGSLPPHAPRAFDVVGRPTATATAPSTAPLTLDDVNWLREFLKRRE